MSKIKEMFSAIGEAYEDKDLQALKLKEQEFAEYQRFEDIITLSVNNYNEALKAFIQLSEVDKTYMAQRHIDYTQYPRELYKFTLMTINKTF